MPTWTDSFALADLQPGRPRVFKQGRDQVAVMRLDDDRLVALDNRCPHEGYPLSQGALSQDEQGRCVLTCNWHNWKFDLSDGACLKGGEDVRLVPVRVVDGRVELDLSPPDPAREIPRLWRSFDAGMVDHDTGRSTRDAVRLLLAGVPPARIAAQAARYDAERAEYGTSHGLAVARDVLRHLPRYPGAQAAIPLAQAIDVCSYAHQRRPVRPLAQPVDPGDDPVAAGETLAQRVEAEDAAAAESLLRGALARGWGRPQLEPWFDRLVSDHFLSFGHRLIYQGKVFDLLAAAGWGGPDASDDARALAEPILCSHLFGILNGTREDLLPAWAGWHRRMADVDLARLSTVPPDAGWTGRDAVVDALVSGTAAQAVQAVADALAAGAPPERVCDALSIAAAERMLRFDVRHDGDQSVQDNWLSVTHTQTFAAAARSALARWKDPRVLRHLFMGARFVNHHKVLDGPRSDIQPRAGTVQDLLDAIRRGDVDGALSLAAARPDGMQDALLDLSLADVAGAPIVQAHIIKNTLVAFDEQAVTGDARHVLALVRLLSSPLQQRWVQQGAIEAVAFVTQGTVPRVLAP